MNKNFVGIPIVLALILPLAVYPISGEPNVVALVHNQPLCLLPIWLPFIILSIGMGLISTIPVSRRVFYLTSGIAGIMLILLPGLVAAWRVAMHPSTLVWLLLLTLCLIGLFLALGLTQLVLKYFWLD